MDQTGGNWDALAEAVRDRREDLGITQEEVAALGGPSSAVQWSIEHAARDSYRGSTLRSLEKVLGWPPGTVRAILNGRGDSGWRSPYGGPSAGKGLPVDLSVLTEEELEQWRAMLLARVEEVRSEQRRRAGT